MDADSDVAIEGLAATMEKALSLHENYPGNKSSLLGKQPSKTDVEKPFEYPHLNHFKPKLDYAGKVAKSCIHCHQIRDAQRLVYRTAGQPLPDQLMFPYPDPAIIGLTFDKETASQIESVFENSPASVAGIQKGDSLISIEGTEISSEADVFWMLHNLQTDTELDLVVKRNGKPVEIQMTLPDGWRKQSDLAWRPTSWEFRRMATGGLTLKPIAAAKRERLSIGENSMALEATHVGKYGQHARARRAGIRKGDIVVSFDGKDNLLSETMINEYAVQQKKPGDRVEIEYLRNGKTKKATIKLQ